MRHSGARHGCNVLRAILARLVAPRRILCDYGATTMALMRTNCRVAA